MGTLQNQPTRESKRYYETEINSFFEQISEISNKHKISKETVIEGFKVLEMRRKNDLDYANGDIHDEQMSGIGEIMEQIASAIQMIGEK